MRVCVICLMVWCSAAAGCAQAMVNGNGDVFVGSGRDMMVFPSPDKDVVRFGVTGAPLTAMQKTVTSQKLPDGSSRSIERWERHVRDSEGRERFEQGVMRDGVFRATTVRLSDPVARMNANLMVDGKVARVSHYGPPHVQTAAESETTARLRELAQTKREARPDRPLVERLPDAVVAGVSARCERSTYVIPAGAEGSAAEVRLVTEVCTSPELRIDLRKSVDDPRRSRITTEVVTLERGEPEAALFVVPEGYEVVEPQVEQAPR